MEPLHLRLNHRSLALSLSRGFTLIELLVVISIMIVMTSLVLTSQSSFNKTLVLANTTYDIALTIRSAESFGVGNRMSGGAANAGYGIHLSSGTPTSFILFADTYPGVACTTPDCNLGDGVYTLGSDVTAGQSYQINNGITISDFCAYSGIVWQCKSTGLTSLDVVFARPNPTPSVRVNGSSATPYSEVCITVSSAQGDSRYIVVEPSGEISAKATSCP